MKKFLKDNLQKIIFIGVVVLVFGVFMLSLTLGGNSNENPTNSQDEVNNQEKPDDSNNEEKPEDTTDNKETEKFKSPCFETDTFSIVRCFYDVNADKETQEMGLIEFGNKYFISKGVSYSLDGETSFDVYSTMSGSVVDVSESNVYGVSITVDHGNGIQTEYVGLSESKVSKGNLVNQGDLIGVSGSAEYDVEAKNHVHFKVSINGEYCNPLEVIGKSIEDLVNEE